MIGWLHSVLDPCGGWLPTSSSAVLGSWKSYLFVAMALLGLVAKKRRDCGASWLPTTDEAKTTLTIASTLWSCIVVFMVSVGVLPVDHIAGVAPFVALAAIVLGIDAVHDVRKMLGSIRADAGPPPPPPTS